MSRKQPLSFQEHVELGANLKLAQDILTTATVKILNSHPRAKYEHRLRAIERDLAAIRSDLDNEVCALFPASVDRVKGKRLVDVYFGGRGDAN